MRIIVLAYILFASCKVGERNTATRGNKKGGTIVYSNATVYKETGRFMTDSTAAKQ